MDEARGWLERARQEAERRLTDLRRDFAGVVAASVDDNADDEHDPEGTTIAFERSQLGALITQARQQLEEIEAALQRLDAGTYGVCTGCGGAIASGRLEARPAARHCIACASAARR